MRMPLETLLVVVKKVKRVVEEVRKQRNLEDIEDKIHFSYEVAKKWI